MPRLHTAGVHHEERPHGPNYIDVLAHQATRAAALKIELSRLRHWVRIADDLRGIDSVLDPASDQRLEPAHAHRPCRAIKKRPISSS